jgi:hypothetical protein
MIRLTLMRWLLTNLIVIGLALAPLSGPLSSAAIAHEMMTHEMMAHGTLGMSDMSTANMPDGSMMSDMTSKDIASKDMASKDLASNMAAEMPCCPDTQKAHDCQDCPFSAICMMKISAAQPASTNGLPVRSAKHELFIAANDVIAAGMNRPPPDQPPRILV